MKSRSARVSSLKGDGGGGVAAEGPGVAAGGDKETTEPGSITKGSEMGIVVASTVTPWVTSETSAETSCLTC